MSVFRVLNTARTGNSHYIYVIIKEIDKCTYMSNIIVKWSFKSMKTAFINNFSKIFCYKLIIEFSDNQIIYMLITIIVILLYSL